MAIDKTKHPENEYHVSFLKSDSSGIPTLPYILNKEHTGKYITPMVHKVFAVFEYLGIESIRVVDSTFVVVFVESAHSKHIRDLVGSKYLTVIATELYGILTALGINEFVRNTENKKWASEFKITDSKLEIFLNDSIKDNGK